jgi:hypothetical protein
MHLPKQTESSSGSGRRLPKLEKLFRIVEEVDCQAAGFMGYFSCAREFIPHSDHNLKIRFMEKAQLSLASYKQMMTFFFRA